MQDHAGDGNGLERAHGNKQGAIQPEHRFQAGGRGPHLLLRTARRSPLPEWRMNAVTVPWASLMNSIGSPSVRDTNMVSEFAASGSLSGFEPSCRNSRSPSALITAGRPGAYSYVPVYFESISGASLVPVPPSMCGVELSFSQPLPNRSVSGISVLGILNENGRVKVF